MSSLVQFHILVLLLPCDLPRSTSPPHKLLKEKPVKSLYSEGVQFPLWQNGFSGVAARCGQMFPGIEHRLLLDEVSLCFRSLSPAWGRGGGLAEETQPHRTALSCRRGPGEYHQPGVNIAYTSGRSHQGYYDLIAGKWEILW